MTALAPPIPAPAAPSPPAAHAAPVALRCVGLAKRYGDAVVVDEMDLVARTGEIVALLGPSGCGKTTTLRLIAGFEPQDSGTIEIGGRLVAGPNPGRGEPPERRRVGMVFQDYALFPHLTVGKNVAFGIPRRGDKERLVRSALATVGLPDHAGRMPHELSGGQQQRVALARALAPGPDIILLDEPFSNLDAALRAAVRAEVRQILREANATAVLVTHDQDEALSLADRVVVMWDGRIVQDATPEGLYHRPATREIAAFVGDAQFLPGAAAGRRVWCELGDLPINGTADGPVDVMLRPESLRLTPESEESPANATVLTRLFYGHDQVLTVRLDTGTTLRARLGSYGGIRPESRVQVSVRGAVQTFSSGRSNR